MPYRFKIKRDRNQNFVSSGIKRFLLGKRDRNQIKTRKANSQKKKTINYMKFKRDKMKKKKEKSIMLCVFVDEFIPYKYNFRNEIIRTEVDLEIL